MLKKCVEPTAEHAEDKREEQRVFDKCEADNEKRHLKGRNYVKKTAVDGKTPCLNWDLFQPNQPYADENLLKENECANPDGAPRDWCHVEEAKSTRGFNWEYC